MPKRFRFKLLHFYLLLTAIFVGLLLGVNLGLLEGFSLLENFDLILQDKVMQREGYADHTIAIIAIDDESLAELGRWPWSRETHAELLDLLSTGEPAVIGMDVIFSEAARDPAEDAAFFEAVARAGNVVLAQYGTFPEGQERGILQAAALARPTGVLAETAALGHINTIPDADGVIRKALHRFAYDDQLVPSFGWAVYEKFLEHHAGSVPAKSIPLDPWHRFHVPFTGGPGEYEAIPYLWVLNGDVPADYFAGRIVLVGPYAAGLQDSYLTPLDAKTPMHGVEVHANIIQTYLEGNYKRELAWPGDLAVLLVLGLVGFVAFQRLHPAWALAVLAALLAGTGLAARLLYGRGLIISIAYVISYLLLLYVGTLAHGYIAELLERRRVTAVFGRYVAPQIVNEILAKGEEGLQLGGTRRELTVLFVDIRGFTPLSEQAEPEEVVAILNEYLDLTANCIFEHEGTLDKFIGDATMAIYNAPLPLKDHALRAVKTAWAMQTRAVALEEKLKERFGFGVKFGIGIHTGPAVFGNIGSKARMDYTAIGDTVNTAARLEAGARPGQVIISEATYLQVKDKVQATPLGTISVKGKEQGIPIYQLDGLK